MSNARPSRFGLMGPGNLPSREAWITLARKAEDLGYDTLQIGDHYIDTYLPIAALLFVADATTRLRISSGIFDTNYRHPVQLAKEVAALDLLSGDVLNRDWELERSRLITMRWANRSIAQGCASGGWRSQ